MFVFFLQKPKGICFFPSLHLYTTHEGDTVENTDPLLVPHNKNKSSAQTSTKIHQNRGKKSSLALSP